MLFVEDYENEKDTAEVAENAVETAAEAVGSADEAAEEVTEAAAEAEEAVGSAAEESVKAPEAAAEAAEEASEAVEDAVKPADEKTKSGEKKSKKKLLLILIPVILVIAAGALAYFLFFNATPAERAQKLVESGDYAAAKEILLEANPDEYDPELLVKCNIGLIKNAINDKGTHGNEGKRIYTIVSENTIYFEVNKDDELVLGQEYENMIYKGDLKMYIDGSQNVFFESESLIEASVYGRTVKAVDTGNGTVDLSKSSNRVTVDSFNSKMDSTYTGTTTTLGDKNSFATTTNTQVARTIGAVNTLIEQMGLDNITIKDLYVAEAGNN